MLHQIKLSANQWAGIDRQGSTFRLVSAESKIRVRVQNKQRGRVIETDVRQGMQIDFREAFGFDADRIEFKAESDQLVEYWLGSGGFADATFIQAAPTRIKTSRVTVASGAQPLTTANALRKSVRIKPDNNAVIGGPDVTAVSGWPVAAGEVMDIETAGSVYAYRDKITSLELATGPVIQTPKKSTDIAADVVMPTAAGVVTAHRSNADDKVDLMFDAARDGAAPALAYKGVLSPLSGEGYDLLLMPDGLTCYWMQITDGLIFVLSSNNGGQSWQQIGQIGGDSIGVTEVNCGYAHQLAYMQQTNELVLLGGQGAPAYNLTTGQWRAVECPYNGTADRFYSDGLAGEIYRYDGQRLNQQSGQWTTDGALALPANTVLKGHSSDLLVAYYSNDIWLSGDGGATWVYHDANIYLMYDDNSIKTVGETVLAMARNSKDIYLMGLNGAASLAAATVGESTGATAWRGVMWVDQYAERLCVKVGDATSDSVETFAIDAGESGIGPQTFTVMEFLN